MTDGEGAVSVTGIADFFVVSASFLASMAAQPVIGTWNDKYDMKKVDAVLFMIACAGGFI